MGLHMSRAHGKNHPPEVLVLCFLNTQNSIDSVLTPWTSHLPANMASASSIAHFFEDLRLPIDADNFTGLNGETYLLPYYLPQKPPFTKPLSSQVLILDADTRPLNESGGILNETWESLTTRWESMNWHTYGRLNHYLWGM